jgi:hypothetical protein
MYVNITWYNLIEEVQNLIGWYRGNAVDLYLEVLVSNLGVDNQLSWHVCRDFLRTSE